MGDITAWANSCRYSPAPSYANSPGRLLKDFGMSTTTYTKYVLIVDCVSLAVTNCKGDCHRRADYSSGWQSPCLVKEENGVVRWLPEDRKSPLMAACWPQKA
jgi:hypothetical protein